MRTHCVLLAFLMLLPAAARAAEEVEAKTVTIRGVTYSVVLDERMRNLGFEFADVAPEENAATYYLRAIEAYWPHNRQDEQELLDLRDKVLDRGWTEESAPLAKYLEKNARTLELIKAASATTACHFPFLLEEGQTLYDASVAAILLPHVQYVREFARLLVVVGNAREFEGSYAEALDAYLLTFRLGHHVAQDPILINGLVGIACNAYGMDAIEQCILRHEIDQDTVAQVQERVRELSKQRPSLAVAMRGEEVSAIEETDHFIRDPGFIRQFIDLETGQGVSEATATHWGAVIQSREGSTWLRRDIREFWDFLGELLRLPLHDFLQKRAEFDARVFETEPPPEVVRMLDANLLDSTRVSTVRMFGPPLWGAVVRYGQDELCWTVLDAELALARYKAKHGEYPESLDDVKELMLSDGIDPFCGELLKYRREADGSFTIWSIGENLKDDGGTTEKGKSRWMSADYVWHSAVIAAEQ